MNIYISGLSYGINNADLTNLFAEFGEVSSDQRNNLRDFIFKHII